MSLQLDFRNAAIKDAKQGNWKSAIEHNLKLIELDPENTNALNRLGVAYIQIAQIPKAKKTFQLVLEIDKNNRIAAKHLDKLKNNKTCTPPSFTKQHFIEEPGTTKIVQLFRLAGAGILEKLSIGQECELKIKNRYVSVEADGKYIGALPEDVSFRLAKLIKNKNRYSCQVRSCSTKHCEVYLKEEFQSEKNKGVHSFPPSKISLNPLSEINPALTLEENIPVVIVQTDNDVEKTFDDVNAADLLKD